jgi:predicted transcriptional regulator
MNIGGTLKQYQLKQLSGLMQSTIGESLVGANTLW